MIFAATLAICLTASITADLVPDHPLPCVYASEPLIIELDSPEALDADVSTTFDAEHLREPVSLQPGRVSLRGGEPYWLVVKEAPTLYGRYSVTLRVAVGQDTYETTGSFCRIARPSSGCPSPVRVPLDTVDEYTMSALHDISLQTVRVDASDNALEDIIERIEPLDMKAVVRLKAADAGAAYARADKLGGHVRYWEIDVDNDPAPLASISAKIRRARPRAVLAMVTDSPEHLAAMLKAGVGRYIDALSVDRAGMSESVIPSLETVAEQAGYERLSILSSSCAGSAETGVETVEVVRRLILDRAAGIPCTELPVEAVIKEKLADSYVYLSSVGRRLCDTEYVGETAAGEGCRALVFRKGGRWQLELWAADKPQTVSLEIGEAKNIELTDSLNNALPAPKLEKGTITVEAGPMPKVLKGEAGTVLLDTAWQMARNESRKLVELNDDGGGSLPDEALNIVKKVASSEEPNAERLDFFTLLRLFPVIEETWHAGELPRSWAVPVMASMSRLLRHLCVVEHERGKPFVEPLQDTLARCREHQSLYLTGSAATGTQTRGDWLMKEVNRLMIEAKKLEAAGRSIEADAVAALAEWRALSLEAASKAAPLHQPDDYETPAEDAKSEQTDEG